MPGKYIIGVDGGSQSSKVVVFDLEGNVICEGRQVLRPMSRPRNGIVEHPDDDLWDSITAASRQAMAQFSGDPREIIGVGLCTIRCERAFLKKDGSLAAPVMSWMDTRAYQPFAHDVPGTAYVTTSSGYITHRFTGRFNDTAANYIAEQWPIDTDTWQWSEDPAVLKRWNIPREMLVELQMPGDVAGHVTPEAAAAAGIPRGLPVVVTANDKAVEALGSGSLGERTALVSLGTYIASMVHGRENRTTPREFWTNFACVPRRYLYESHGIRRGMWTISWFLDLLGPELARAAEASGLSREQYLEREAAHVSAGSDGLMTVLDWLAPTDQPFRKGVMIGFDARHTRGHVYRSILEAIALTMKNRVDAMCDGARHLPGIDRRLGRRRQQPPVHAHLRGRLRHPVVAQRGQRRGQPGRRHLRGGGRGRLPGLRERRGRDDQGPRVVRPGRCQRRRLPAHEPAGLRDHP